jgi:hypothetical protein
MSDDNLYIIQEHTTKHINISNNIVNMKTYSSFKLSKNAIHKDMYIFQINSINDYVQTLSAITFNEQQFLASERDFKIKQLTL